MGDGNKENIPNESRRGFLKSMAKIGAGALVGGLATTLGISKALSSSRNEIGGQDFIENKDGIGVTPNLVGIRGNDNHLYLAWTNPNNPGRVITYDMVPGANFDRTEGAKNIYISTETIPAFQILGLSSNKEERTRKNQSGEREVLLKIFDNLDRNENGARALAFRIDDSRSDSSFIELFPSPEGNWGGRIRIDRSKLD